MKTLYPYLVFAGNCEEALNFYKEAFGGEAIELRRFDEMDANLPAEQKNRIMHAHFVAEGLTFMASDAMPDQDATVASGTNFTLLIDLDNEAEQTKIFQALANGGQIAMPLEDTFWNARFGTVIDKYGFSWSLNCDKK